MNQDHYTTKEAKYKRIDKDMRIKIECWQYDKISNSEIARRLSVHKSTIGREIERGLVDQVREVKVKPTYENYYQKGYVKEYYKEYSADVAQDRADQLALSKHRCHQVLDEQGYADFIDSQILSCKYKSVSVYTANTLAKQQGYEGVSDRTLYNWIDKGLLKTKPIDLLLTVQRKPSHKSKPKINKRIYGNSIELRPKEVQARLEFGHFEGDSIMGADNSGHIITLTERKTRDGFMFVFKEFSSKNIKFAKQILLRRFGKLFYKIFKSVTFDNGSEFSYNIQDSQLQVYYAHPSSPYERGSNENFNGIVRRFIKKGKDFSTLTTQDIHRINTAINNIPRKLLGGKSAHQCFEQEVQKLINTLPKVS